MKQFVGLLLMVFIANNALGQSVTLSGYIKDGNTGETLPAASIFVSDLKRGVKANMYGFYSITVPKGSHDFRVTYVGYTLLNKTINLEASKKENFELTRRRRETKKVVIKSRKADANVESTDVGLHTLSVSDVKKLPVILGEVDVLKAIQLLPGVNSAGEGQSGFYVRGGGPDQNLILLDDAPVYNSGHLFGFFSVFNADAIKNVTLIKGGMPAQYGGRLSSVVDITMKDGNNKNYEVDGGIGLIASRLAIQGPIVKDKSSFIVSARRTYIDALTRPFVNKESAFAGSGYYFYDLNAKINHTFSDKDRLYLSGYFGRDVFTFRNEGGNFNINIPWGNSTGTLRWNHLFNDKLFMNTTVLYNDYNFAFNGEFQNNSQFRLYSGIRDLGIKSDIDYYSKFNHNFKAGVNYTFHTFTPTTVGGQANGVEINPDLAPKKYAHEMGAYIQDEFDLGEHVKINAGLRYSHFLQVGPYTQYDFADEDKKIITDSTYFGRGDIAQSYGGFEPRLNARFALNNASSIKASVARNYQYIHLVTNNGSTLPTDLWTPSSYYVRPQKGWQYSLGYFRNFLDDALETSVEVYYKDMKNLLEYREGYTPDQIRDVDFDFVFGTGQAYGAEFFVNKVKGKWTGWISYTLAWTERLFPDLNNNEKYFAKYDQRHNFSFVNTYELNKKWTLSALFVFGSGTRVTLPTSLYTIINNGDPQLVSSYDKLNNQLIPAYHRFDIGAVYTPTPKKNRNWQSSWNFGIYNVYSRQNPYFLYLDLPGNLNDPGGVDIKIKQVSVFPIIPSITYNFKWKQKKN